jgi:TolA-binding protein
MARTSKLSGFAGPMMMCLIVIGVSGCGESPQAEFPLNSAADDIPRTADGSAAEIVNSIGPAREAFLTKMKAQLRTIDAKIEELAKREQNISEAARTEWNTRVDQLMVQRDAARRRLKSLSEASELGWNDMRDRAVTLLDDLAKAVDDAASQ